MNPEGELVEGDVLIRDGVVEAVGSNLRSSGAEVISARDRIVLPGLINAHLHSHHMVEKGGHEGLRLDRRYPAWLRAARAVMGPRTFRVAAEACYADSLQAGVVFIGDVLTRAARPEDAGDAMRRVGISGVIYARRLPVDGRRSTASKQRIRYGFAVPEETARSVNVRVVRQAMTSQAGGVGVHMHVCETSERRDRALKRWGCGTPRFLDRQHLLTDATVLSHCGYINEDDISVIAAAGSAVVVCPSSALKLRHRLAPIRRLIRNGVPLLIGTDGAAYNNGNDMLLTLRLLCLMRPWGQRGDEGVHPVQALRWVTSEAAAWFGVNTGRIEAGRDADIILIDGRNLRVRPLIRAPYDNVVANIVLSATGQDVTDVLIGGRFCVKNRRVLTVSTEDCVERLQAESERVMVAARRSLRGNSER